MGEVLVEEEEEEETEEEEVDGRSCRLSRKQGGDECGEGTGSVYT